MSHITHKNHKSKPQDFENRSGSWMIRGMQALFFFSTWSKWLPTLKSIVQAEMGKSTLNISWALFTSHIEKHYLIWQYINHSPWLGIQLSGKGACCATMRNNLGPKQIGSHAYTYKCSSGKEGDKDFWGYLPFNLAEKMEAPCSKRETASKDQIENTRGATWWLILASCALSADTCVFMAIHIHTLMNTCMHKSEQIFEDKTNDQNHIGH